jgi:S1-C subfamily serine protease
MRVTPLLFLLALTASFPAFAQPVAYHRYLYGTGFVINNDGHIITNAHVVKDCESISVLTARGEQKAFLIASDPQRDLAVLKSPYISPYIAPLRWNIRDLKVGDEVVVMGYPGTEGAYEHYQFKKTKVTNLQGPPSKEELIQLDGVAARGNSGGPVLDTNGNVIAVLSGMTLTFRVDENGAVMGTPVSQSDVAVPLVALQDFLHEHEIDFYESNSDGHAYGDNALRDSAHNFILPVRCMQDVESR